MWCHLSTGFRTLRSLRFVALVLLFVALTTTLLFASFSSISHATTGTNKTVNFQGRLLTASGSTVPDGFYNIQFKIYQDGDGKTAGDTGGSLKWTETYLNNGGNNGVEVKNGFLSVNLGSINPFGTSVDWNQDTLWLSMNIAGASTSCTTFGSAPCTSDGEMLPMKQLTATPYAINSGAVGGKTADDLVQLGQGTQTDASNNSSIAVNKTGTGNLIQLQNTSSDVFTVDNSGDLTFGSTSDKSISVATAAASTAGVGLNIAAGGGGSGTGSSGGNLTIQGGAAGGTNGNGGNIVLSGGTGTGTGVNGSVIISTPTFSTVTNDANCYTSGANVATSCTIAASSVNNSSAVIVGFSTTGKTATLPDPAITTAGRVMYVTASGDSAQFSLLTNGGASHLTMRANTTETLLWNGSDWTASGASNSTTLQDTYDNTASGDSAAVTVSSSSDGLTVRDSSVDPVNGKVFDTQDSDANSLFSVKSDTTGSNVQIGDGSTSGDTTLLSLDKATAAPTVDSSMLGSMYYDTTLGVVQCYEASGWGACGASPDDFVTLSPEYSNAVVHSTGIGTMSNDLCSDALNINDGSSSQPTICGTNETYNYYNWTSSELTAQTRSIYVTYQLPSTFKNFAAGQTSLMGRTDSSDSDVSYQIYKNDPTTGLTACGSAVATSTGVQTTWQKATAATTADPSNCGFVAGDSIVFKIDLTSANDANAYASNLSFVTTNN